MNSKLIGVGGLAAAAALALGAALAAPTLAQGVGPTQMPRMGQMGQMGQMGMRGGMMGIGGPQSSLVSVAADKLGLTQAELVAKLNANKTIADVAAEKNVEPATIVDAFLAPRIAQMNAAVTAGRLTQAQADEMIAAMRANITSQLSQPWTARGPGSGAPGSAMIDSDQDGVCDHMEQGGQVMPRFQRGPRR